MKQKDVRSGKWTCMICGEVYPTKEALLVHYENHKAESQMQENTGEAPIPSDYYYCSTCFSEYTSLRSYKVHLETKHGERTHLCEICNKFFKTAYTLCLHNYNFHKTGQYKCIYCPFVVEHKRDLSQHLQEEHGTGAQFKCEICSEEFDDEHTVEQHKELHEDLKSLTCELCDRTFSYSRFLVAHKKEQHPEIYSQLSMVNECPLCLQRFAHKKSLILHIRGHSGENNVLCEVCGKCLSSSEHLKHHSRIHTGYKPHICAVCGKGFAKKCNLTLHERVHTGEKPYVCRYCAKAFSQRSTLVIHERYHSGSKPYVCHFCKKGFVARGLLNAHIKVCNTYAV